MKIRIKGNSIRYRLTQTEVTTFCRTGYFSDRTEFQNGIFKYELRAKEGIDKLEAEYKKDTITLYLPVKDKDIWGNSEQVGFQNIIGNGHGQELFLLVEKDFVCLDDTAEDQSDNYPNPLAKKS
jgi:Family of unknown function (DUF7009)